MRRVVVSMVLVAGILVIPSTAQAVDLTSDVCTNDLGGTWDASTSTCTAPDMPDDFTLTIPSGVTLVPDPGLGPDFQGTRATIVNNGTFGDGTTAAIFVAGSFTNNGTVDLEELTFDGQPLVNSGSISADPLFFEDGTLTNSGSITVLGSSLIGFSTVSNTGNIEGAGLRLVEIPLFDNFGTVVASVFDVGTLVNHCNATATITTISDTDTTVTDLTCDIAVTITPVPTSGTAPLTVDWTVTLSNEGTEDLTAPQVELSADGGTTVFATLVAQPDSGDIAGTGVLNAGETWSWTVRTTENANITVTATGAGTVGPDVITFPDDPDARAAASVTVAPAPTTTTTTTTPTTPTTVAPTTTSSIAGSTTSTTISATTSSTVSSTLPFTGTDGTSTGLGIAAMALLLAGIGLIAGANRTRRRPSA